ncbi:XdhC family protein [Pelagibacterium montanilacus]|uniref:XdhC family protein n=1 Tax=Pelagibacterium montanilacus TaxID=2185280 RepID=UPI000F8E7BBD|nr:XdhC family protein [Pelagibacterium montanilacus]
MSPWTRNEQIDDIRPALLAAAEGPEPFALATIVAADGGPRPVGTQMVVTHAERTGFLSGGCIEGDVACHARAVIAEGRPRRLVYGRSSPFIDIRLPCGGQLVVLVERLAPGDRAITALEHLSAARRPAFYASDGYQRATTATAWRGSDRWPARALFVPRQRLIVVGTDPFALALVTLAEALGWKAVLLPPAAADPARLAEADPWTAIAILTHDTATEVALLAAVLRSDAGFVGVMGSRSRIAARRARLLQAGVPEPLIGRLRAPIGLEIGARAPMEIATAIVGEIIAASGATPGSRVIRPRPVTAQQQPEKSLNQASISRSMTGHAPSSAAKRAISCR